VVVRFVKQVIDLFSWFKDLFSIPKDVLSESPCMFSYDEFISIWTQWVGVFL
jgi:hypothetical protein